MSLGLVETVFLNFCFEIRNGRNRINEFGCVFVVILSVMGKNPGEVGDM